MHRKYSLSDERLCDGSESMVNTMAVFCQQDFKNHKPGLFIVVAGKAHVMPMYNSMTNELVDLGIVERLKQRVPSCRVFPISLELNSPEPPITQRYTFAEYGRQTRPPIPLYFIESDQYLTPDPADKLTPIAAVNSLNSNTVNHIDSQTATTRFHVEGNQHRTDQFSRQQGNEVRQKLN